MATKSFLRAALLAVVGLGLLASVGLSGSNLVTDTEHKIKKDCDCEPCEQDKNKANDAKRVCEGSEVAKGSPAVLPTLGEPVELHMVSGDTPKSSEWIGTPNFGNYRYLSWIGMVSIPSGSDGSPADLAHVRRACVRVLIPGTLQVVSFQQVVPQDQQDPWNIYRPVTGTGVMGTEVPSGAELRFYYAPSSVYYPYCILSYPDGRSWRFDFIDFDAERTPYSPIEEDNIKRIAAAKYRLTKYTDRNGYEVNATYGASSMTITDASGNQYVCEHNSAKVISRIVLKPAGSSAERSWSYTYSGYTATETNNQTGESVAVTTTSTGKAIASIMTTGPGGVQHSEVFTRDSAGLLTKVTINGVETSVSETGQVETVAGEVAGRPDLETCAINTRVTFLTRDGATTECKYGPYGPLSEKTALAGGGVVESKTYRLPDGRETKRVDGNGQATTYTYDANYNKTAEHLPNGTENTYTYDANQNLLTKTTPDGVWSFEYDSHNLLTRERFVSGSVTLSDVSYTRYPWLDGSNPHPQRGLVEYKDEKVVSGESRTRRTRYAYNVQGQVIQRRSWYSDETQPSAYWAYGYDSWGNRTSETNPLGQTTSYTYDGENRLVSVTDALSHTTTYAYDGIGRKVKVTDALGSYTEWHYDSRGFVTSITGSAAMGGGCTSCGQAAGAGDKLGTYTYSDGGLLLSYTDLNNHTWSYTYDNARRKVKDTDPTGYETTYTYDGDGNLLTVTDSNGHATTYTYDSMGRLASVTNGAGETTSYTYDWAGRQLTVTGPVAGSVVTTVYDKLGRVVTVTDARGKVMTYAYDMLGRQTLVTAATGSADQVQTSFGYDADDNLLVTVEDVGGLARTTANEYDAADRLVKTTVDPDDGQGDPELSLVTSFGYDAAGRLVSSTVDPAGLAIATTYTYDNVGRQLTSTTGYLTTTTTYNAAGWVITTSNGVTTTSYEYDEVGNRTKMTVSGRNPVFYTYDDANRLTATSQAIDETKTIVTSRTPDGVNLTLESTDPNGNVVSYTYDGANRVLTATNAEGETTAYAYTDAGRVTTMTAPDGGVVETTRDVSGNVVSVKDQLNRTTSYVYDDLSRPVSVTQPDGVAHATVYDKLSRAVTVTEDVGGLDRVMDREYDIAGRLVKVTVDPSGLALVTSYEYDKASRRTKTVSDPDNGEGDPEVNLATAYTYDPLGLVLTTTTGESAGAHVTVTNAYNVGGQLVTTGNGVTTTTLAYDQAGAVSSRTVSGRAPIVYTYDAAGRLIQTSQTVGEVTIATTYTLDLGGRVVMSADGEGKVTKLAYDGANRVVAETNPAGEVTTYAYDANGRQTLAAMANGSRSATEYNKAGEVTKTMGGPSGSVRYAYDQMGRLVVVTDANGRTRTTDYDHLGRKIRTKNEMLQAVAFDYDLAGRWTTLTDPNGNVTTWAYDGASRQKTMTYPVVTGQPTNVESYEYNAAGLMSKKTTPNGVDITYTYDDGGNVETIVGPNVGETEYSRDEAGAVTVISGGASTMEFVYDQFGRVTGVSDSGAGKSLSYAYDKRSLRTSMTGDLPEGIAYTYDNAGRLVTVKKGNDTANTYAYDGGGRRQSLELANGVKTAYAFDGNDRLLSLTTTATAGTVASFGYQLDKVGNRLVMAEKDYTLSYKYDQAYRNTGEIRTRNADGLMVYSDEFTYDAAGNRLTRKKSDFGGAEPALQTPYGLWPLNEVTAKPFTPPAAAFTADGSTLGLYHLEESESPMVDSSAAANDGTIVDTVATEAQGMFGSACVRIEPDAQTPGRIEADAVELGSGNFTLEAFVNPEVLTAERTVLAQMDENGQPVVMLSLAEGCPALLVRYSVGTEVGEVRIVGKTQAETNAWKHLAAVRNGQGLYLYMGGECVAVGELPANAEVLAAEKLLIGSGSTTGTGLRAAGNFAGRLDEVRISSVARYTGVTTPETTANGPDGELVGGVALASGTDRAGAWLAFDGTGYVQLTDTSDFLKVAATKRTIEMWVKAASTSGTQVLFESGDSTNGFGLKIDAGNLVFGVTSGGTAKTVSATYTSTDWHKVTAVYDGSTTNGTMTLYVDGSSVATDANVGFNSVGTTTDGAALGGTLGSDAFGGSTTGGSFTGSIDAVRVMNDAVAPLAMAVENTTYTYNERSQLVTEAIAGGTTKTYYYNRNGENTEKDPDPQSQDYNVAIEEKSGQTVVSTERKEYDDFGRMTKWSKTDATGTVTEEHTYRGAGWERASTKVNGGDETRYLYDGDNVVGDLVGGAFTRQYVTPFLDENVSMTVQGGTPATYFYSRDGLGSVRTLTDGSQVVQNRYAYSAFGEPYKPTAVPNGYDLPTSEAVGQRYQFQGREAGVAGAPMYYRSRMYSVSLGRFGRRDPRLGGDSLYHLYVFPGLNPLMCCDPLGLGGPAGSEAPSGPVTEIEWPGEKWFKGHGEDVEKTIAEYTEGKKKIATSAPDAVKEKWCKGLDRIRDDAIANHRKLVDRTIKESVDAWARLEKNVKRHNDNIELWKRELQHLKDIEAQYKRTLAEAEANQAKAAYGGAAVGIAAGAATFIVTKEPKSSVTVGQTVASGTVAVMSGFLVDKLIEAATSSEEQQKLLRKQLEGRDSVESANMKARQDFDDVIADALKQKKEFVKSYKEQSSQIAYDDVPEQVHTLADALGLYYIPPANTSVPKK